MKKRKMNKFEMLFGNSIVNTVTGYNFTAIPDYLRDYALNQGERNTYAVILRAFSIESKKDSQGRTYIEKTRKELGTLLMKSSRTITRHIKKLVQVGLLADRRRGLNLTNHIYLCKVSSLLSKQEPSSKANLSAEKQQLVEALNQKLERLTPKKCPTYRALKILDRAKDDLNEVDLAIDYILNTDKEPKNHFNYLLHTLREGYYKDHLENKQPSAKPSVNKPAKNTYQKPKGAFHRGISHGYDDNCFEEYTILKSELDSDPNCANNKVFMKRYAEAYKRLTGSSLLPVAVEGLYLEQNFDEDDTGSPF